MLGIIKVVRTIYVRAEVRIDRGIGAVTTPRR